MGNVLLVVGLLIVWWFVVVVTGPVVFVLADGVLTSWFGKLVMLGLIWALWYYSLGGLWYLVWDSGWMLDVASLEWAGQVMVALLVVLMVVIVIIL